MMNYINHLPLQFERGIEEEEKSKHKSLRINIKNPYSKPSKDNKGDIEPQTPPLSNETVFEIKILISKEKYDL